MTKSYAQIKATIARLEKEAAALRGAETAKVIAQIKESIATFGLTVEQLFGRGAKALKASAAKGKAVRKGAGIPKYRHPRTGQTWTGFGKAPAWIATARNRDKFLIVEAATPAPKAEKPVAKKATAKRNGSAKKAAPGSRAAAVPEAAKAPGKAVAKARSPRAAKNAAAPVETATPPVTTQMAASAT